MRKLVPALITLLAISCTTKPPIEREPPTEPRVSAHELAATVVLLSANRDRHPCCSAVSVLDAHGAIILETAAHCVVHKVNQDDPAPDAVQWANIGDSIWYQAKDAYYPQRSELKTYDAVRDRATLEPVDGDPPAPLALRTLCDRCSLDGTRVHAVSALYDQTRNGLITGRTFAGQGAWFWESDMSIIPGWSGSPVLNEAGQVVGIMSKCNGVTLNAGDKISRSCVPGWSLFASAL